MYGKLKTKKNVLRRRNITHPDDLAVGGRVLVLSLGRLSLRFWVSGVLQVALLLRGDPVARFVGVVVAPVEVDLLVLSQDRDRFEPGQLVGSGQGETKSELEQKPTLSTVTRDDGITEFH